MWQHNLLYVFSSPLCPEVSLSTHFLSHTAQALVPFLIIVRVGFGLTHTLKVKKKPVNTVSGSTGFGSGRTGQSISIMQTQDSESTTSRGQDIVYKGTSTSEYPMEEYITFSDKHIPSDKDKHNMV